MNDRFKLRVPVYMKFGKFKEFVYWYAGDGFSYREAKEGDEFWQIEQCTGLKDKNGRLIYEGDILKTVLGRIVEVKFGKTGYNSEFTFCAVGFFLVSKGFWGEDYINFRETPYYEVIGNIHENADLLEEQNGDN